MASTTGVYVRTVLFRSASTNRSALPRGLAQHLNRGNAGCAEHCTRSFVGSRARSSTAQHPCSGFFVVVRADRVCSMDLHYVSYPLAPNLQCLARCGIFLTSRCAAHRIHVGKFERYCSISVDSALFVFILGTALQHWTKRKIRM